MKYKVRLLETSSLNDNFWRWFGNSKVVDTEGNPLVMYHGTTSEFDVFDITKSGQSNDKAGVGFWFSPVEEFGNNFIRGVWYGDKKEKVVRAYLSIKNPKIYKTFEPDKQELSSVKKDLIDIKTKRAELEKNYGWNSVILGTTTMDEFNFFRGQAYKGEIRREVQLSREAYIKVVEQQKYLQTKIDSMIYTDAYEQFRTDIYFFAGKTARDANIGGLGMAIDNIKEVVRSYRNSLIQEGYDGIFILGTNFDASDAGGTNDQYVAFYPNQIKSIDNRGTWNNNSDNIYESYEEDYEDEDQNEPVMSIKDLNDRREWLAKLAQKVYDDWDEEDVDTYANGGICHLIADAFSDYLNFHGIETVTVSSNHEQHVYCVSKVLEGIYTVDIHWSYYETGGGYNWKKIPNVVFDGSEINFYKISSDYTDWEQYTEVW